jgi:germination protein M
MIARSDRFRIEYRQSGVDRGSRAYFDRSQRSISYRSPHAGRYRSKAIPASNQLRSRSAVTRSLLRGDPPATIALQFGLPEEIPAGARLMKRQISMILLIVANAAVVGCTGSAAPGTVAPVVPVESAAPSIAPVASPRPAEPSQLVEPTIVPPTPSPTPNETRVVRVYFFLDGPPGSAGLVPVLRDVPATPAVARAAMEELLDGPDARERDASPPISDRVPVGTKLLGLTIDDGVATVDLSSEFETGNENGSQIGRLGQVVYTLTQFSTVRSVAFRIEGRPVRTFGSEGIVLEGPVGRADLVDVEPFQSMFEGVLPAIFVDGPAWGAALGNPGRITGTANTYEAWFMVGVYDANGRALNDGTGQATCGTGCRGTFDTTIDYAVSTPQWGTLRVLDGDESGETEGIIREYPVWLTPGPPAAEHSCGC